MQRAACVAVAAAAAVAVKAQAVCQQRRRESWRRGHERPAVSRVDARRGRRLEGRRARGCGMGMTAAWASRARLVCSSAVGGMVRLAAKVEPAIHHDETTATSMSATIEIIAMKPAWWRRRRGEGRRPAAGRVRGLAGRRSGGACRTTLS